MPTPYARATSEAPPTALRLRLLAVMALTALAAVIFLSLPAQAQSGTLTVGLEPPVRLDPAFASSDSEIAVINAVYDYLVDIDAGNQIQPRLAESWDVSSDGLRYTFQLVPGVVFHDGTPLTAEDVAWTFNRLRDASLELPTADLYANIEAIETNGEHEITFTLRETNPFFIYDLSDNRAVVVQAGATDLGSTFNGTGPFKVESYSVGNRMRLVANEDYFIAGKPGVARLELIFFSDQAASVDALRGGQVDLVMRMPTPLFLTLQQTPGIETVNVPTNAFDLVRLRADRGPGSDPRVQQALKLATDREAIVELVTLGLAAPGKDSPIGPLFSAYFAEDLEVPTRDPERARALLAEAGYEDGLSLTLHTPDTGDRPDLAVVLQEQWAEAGIQLTVNVEPESVYYGDDRWLTVDLGITGWGSRPVPQFYFEVMLACDARWNEAHWCDEETDELIRLAGTTLDEDERVRAYRELQALLLERGPIIIPYFFPQFGAIREGFSGFEMKAFPGRTDLAAIQAP